MSKPIWWTAGFQFVYGQGLGYNLTISTGKPTTGLWRYLGRSKDGEEGFVMDFRAEDRGEYSALRNSDI